MCVRLALLRPPLLSNRWVYMHLVMVLASKRRSQTRWIANSGFCFFWAHLTFRQRLRRRDMVVMLFGNDAKWSHTLTVLSATLLLALEDGRVSVCVFQLLSVLLSLAPVTRHHGETRAVLTQPPHGSELRTCFDRLPVRTNEATSELFSHWYDVTGMTQSSNSPCTSAGEARLSAMTIDPKLTVSQPSHAIPRTQYACGKRKI
jgi:hypothetical protein